MLWKDSCGYVWGKKNERVEVPITNERLRQSYYGVLDYKSKKFIVKEYDKGNSENTVKYLKYLLNYYDGKRLLIIWDNATYHKYGETRKYLKELNHNLAPKDWKITLINFATNAPEQNPVEDIWLQGKNNLRKHYYECSTFKNAKDLFFNYINDKKFKFKKVYLYDTYISYYK